MDARYYPPGSANDPRAPYNQVDEDEVCEEYCEDCDRPEEDCLCEEEDHHPWCASMISIRNPICDCRDY